ncbi:MAG: metallophosphoesterase family protein [Oscillospiraceae bacterium]
MRSVIKLDLPEKCRIIAVSDIHTSCGLLDIMLRKADYKPGEDYLIIVGDILEHWENNINTLKYVYELCKADRTYCLLGNNDTFAARMAFTYPYKRFAEKFYYSENGIDNAFLQMAKSVGYDYCTEENWLDIRKAVIGKYGKELEFLRDLPICIETDTHVFVHAGLENRPDWRNTDDTYAITAKWFMREQNPTGKWLVVGHFPTYNYKRSNATNLPIIDCEKKMIDIDGGLSIKTACQMNFLVINKNGKDYTHEVIWETPFEKRKVTKDHYSETAPVYVDWSNQDMVILGEKDGMMKVRDNVTGGEGYIPQREIYDFDGKLHVYQFLSSFPTVKKGENVSVCAECRGMYLVITERAEVGWIPADIID